MIEIFFLSILVGVGLVLIILKPVSRTTQISPLWEIGFGSLTIIAFLIYLVSIFVTPMMVESDLAKQPCGPDSPQARCYDLEQDLCLAAWQNSEVSCKTEIRELTKDRPSALIGKMMSRCQAKKMDKVMHFNRKQEEDSYCRAYFDFVEEKDRQ